MVCGPSGKRSASLSRALSLSGCERAQLRVRFDLCNDHAMAVCRIGSRALSLSGCERAQLRVRFDTDAVKLPFRPDSPQWPKLLSMGAASSLATLFVARNFFPAEKKVRHPIRANYNIGDDVFVRTMGHLLGPSLVEGNKVTPIENGDQIFPAMLSGIRSAQRTITFENFLFQEGEISDAFHPGASGTGACRRESALSSGCARLRLGTRARHQAHETRRVASLPCRADRFRSLSAGG
jgi:hypothetical protein